MRITDLIIKERGDNPEVSADVDGFRLWYRVPCYLSCVPIGRSFFGSAILPAMSQGESLEIDPSTACLSKASGACFSSPGNLPYMESWTVKNNSRPRNRIPRRAT